MTRQAIWCVEDEPGTPWDNMAVDTAMLAGLNARPSQLPIIRVYQWDRTSVSMGRLQSEEAVERLYPGFPRVRRPTGGRAVLHGQDLTVSVAARLDWLPKNSGQGVLSSHRLLMTGVIDAFAAAGCRVSFGTGRAGGTRNSVLCFDRAADCDLVDAVSGRKIAGSAQRREGSSLLQQMSIPLDSLPNPKGFIDALQSGFREALGVEEWLRVDTPCTV